MAKFSERFYTGEALAANDIGAVSYFGEVEVLDLMGLASLDVAKAKLAGRFDAASILELADQRGATTAVVYEHWFTGSSAFNISWLRVASWTISDPVVSDPKVTFFARNAAAAALLRRRLSTFERELPARVHVLYY
jgi:hypothetical protein